MTMLLRRFLIVAALMFWQGGFTFYAAVVVPVGRQILDTPGDQSRVTRPVTNYLNLAGAVALLPFAWDILACRDGSTWRRFVRWGMWLGMAATLVLLVWLHGVLESRLTDSTAPGSAPFRTVHRIYLWICTVQWVCVLVYLGATLLAWRAADRLGGLNAAPPTNG